MVKKKTKEFDIIFGVHSVTEVLYAKKRKIMQLYVAKTHPKAWKKIVSWVPKYVQIQYVTANVLSRIAESSDHQGMVAYVAPFPFQKSFFDPKKSLCLLLIDGVQDPRNLGSLLRSAYCTHFDGVIMIKKGGAPLSAVAHKASAGLAEYLAIYRAASSKEAVQLLIKAGYQLYTAVSEGDAQSTHQIRYVTPLCVVIGGEGCGVSQDAIKKGINITLPQKRSDISYNASVAGGILLFLIATQLRRI